MSNKTKTQNTGMLPEISSAMNGNCKSFSINLKHKTRYVCLDEEKHNFLWVLKNVDKIWKHNNINKLSCHFKFCEHASAYIY